jgi:FkbM family methyltransferase
MLNIKAWVKAIAAPLARQGAGYFQRLPPGNPRSMLWYLGLRGVSERIHFSTTVRIGPDLLFSCTTQDIIQRRLTYFGIWEPDLTAVFRDALEEGDHFLDIGANIGYFTLLASRWVGPTGRVYSIEASPRIFKHLQELVVRNECNNVDVRNVAASDSIGEVRISPGPDWNEGATSVVVGGSMGDRVDCVPVLSEMSVDQVRRFKAVKIDVEGYEGIVCKDLLKVADGFRPDVRIVMEMDPRRKPPPGGMEAQEILNSMRSRGYVPLRIPNDYSDEAYLGASRTIRLEKISDLASKLTDCLFVRPPIAEKLQNVGVVVKTSI